MNAKRWIALLLVFVLIIISGVTKLTSTFLTSDKEEQNTKSVVSSLLSSNELTEKEVKVGSENKVAILSVDGTIQNTGEDTSLFSSSGYNHVTFMEELEAVRKDSNVKAVLLYVNSPGGGVMESAQIRDKILQIKSERKIPFYVSMGSMAASGGYYISTPADKIFASKETLTGSLGVIMRGYDYSELMKKVGISDNTIKSGEYKDIMSGSRPMTAEEKQIMQRMIDDSYNEFVQVVEEGRNMTEAEVKKIADGRIYDGRQAKEIGLIDEFGYQETALAALQKDYNLQDATVFKYDAAAGFGSLFSSAATSLSGKNADLITIMKQTGTLEAPRMMYLYGE